LPENNQNQKYLVKGFMTSDEKYVFYCNWSWAFPFNKYESNLTHIENILKFTFPN
jgi:hypothetical protein